MCLYAQSYLTLCNPMDCKLPGSSVHGIFQARILEWVTISASRGSSQPRDRNPHLWCLLHWHADSLLTALPGKLVNFSDINLSSTQLTYKNKTQYSILLSLWFSQNALIYFYWTHIYFSWTLVFSKLCLLQLTNECSSDMNVDWYFHSCWWGKWNT